jgi:DNA helicase IV
MYKQNIRIIDQMLEEGILRRRQRSLTLKERTNEKTGLVLRANTNSCRHHFQLRCALDPFILSW